MVDKEITQFNNKDLNFKNITVERVENVKDALCIFLSNGQKLLSIDKKVYDVSDYDHFMEIIEFNNKKCGIFTKDYGDKCLVDLESGKVLFEDDYVYYIHKVDDRVISVTFHSNGAKLYNIEEGKYMPRPEGYTFDMILNNGLYVFCEDNYDSDRKRLIMDGNGNILVSGIEGYVQCDDNNLVVNYMFSKKKEQKITVISFDKDKKAKVREIKKEDTMLTKPEYCNGKILVVEKGVIKIFDTNLTLVKKVEIEDLNAVLDSCYLNDKILMLLYPYEENGKVINKHVFVNLDSGKTLSFVRIDEYPAWNPTTFIGRNTPGFENGEYSFYDESFNLIRKVKCDFYEGVGEDKKLYILRTNENGENKKELLNIENGEIKDIEYDLINYHNIINGGWGVNLEKEKMDFFDKDLNVIIRDFDYKKYGIRLNDSDFHYFIVNDYVCIDKHLMDDFGRDADRYIIYKSSGEEVLDSYKYKCYPLGDFIQVVDKTGKSKFLDTISGELGDVELSLPLKENGEIDLEKIKNINKYLSVSRKSSGLLGSEETKRLTNKM